MNFTYCTTYPGGAPISNPGTTPSTGIELGGSGTPITPFVITDNLAVVANGLYNPSGAFIQQLANLSPGPHRFELRENASLPVTDVWLLTVGAVEDTTIDAMNGYPSGAPISNGGETLDPGVTLTGTAAAGRLVDVYNGTVFIGQATANPSGSWTLILPNLPFAVCRFTAKVGSGQNSVPVWVLYKNYLEDFESFSSLSMGVGGFNGNAFLDIIYFSGPPGSMVAITQAVPVEGAITGQSLQPSYLREAPYSGLVVIDIRLRAPCSRVHFWSGAVSAPASVDFHNAAGGLLGSRSIPHTPVGSILHLTDFSAAGISRISLKTTGGDWCNFDTFTFRP
jgi:hypothetical protein